MALMVCHLQDEREDRLGRVVISRPQYFEAFVDCGMLRQLGKFCCYSTPSLKRFRLDFSLWRCKLFAEAGPGPREVGNGRDASCSLKGHDFCDYEDCEIRNPVSLD